MIAKESQRVSITLHRDLVKLMDDLRGKSSVSKYIEGLLLKEIMKERSNNK